MPFDGSVVNSVVNELRSRLVNAKIDKIHQPEKDELVINIRSYKDSFKLFLSASPNYPRLHITNEARTNPAVPPSFCMLLRKHLTGGRIMSVTQPNFERIVEIEVECFDELGYSNRKALVCEIMGKHSNIVFIDKGSNKIIDSIKRIDFEISSVREILPGREYTYPPSERQNPLEFDEEKVLALMQSTAVSIKSEKFFIKNFNGISPASAREICLHANLDSDADIKSLDSISMMELSKAFVRFFNKIKEARFAPQIVFENAVPMDFYCFELELYRKYEVRHFALISDAVESYYFEKDRKDRIRQKAGDIYRIITNRLDRCNKKLEILHDEIIQAENSDKYKIYGDLLTSNLHMLEKGQTQAMLVNYYSEKCETIEIKLDNQLTPVQNAQRYYKLYNKSKNALRNINGQISENLLEIKYLESQLDNLEKCTEETEINEIRDELADQGYIKSRQQSKNKHQKPSKPLHYVSASGFDIYVGKNNVQNDYLTIKFAANNDLWLHTKDIPGSHVIVKTNGQNVDDKTLEEASMLAAYYSKAKQATKVPVDYTPRKNVKKPNGSKPGMVIYENNRTVYIDPDENVIKAMKKM